MHRIGRAVRQYGLGVGVLLALTFVAYRLVLAPIHGVRDAAGCRRAFAEARTHTDTLSADNLSYPEPRRRGVRQRCGDLRTREYEVTSHSVLKPTP